MTRSLTDDLHAAWAEWDDRPSAEREACQMVEASGALASQMGTTTPLLRRSLSRARREGMDRHHAIAAAEADLAARPKETDR